jgi:hypothetical protein
MHHTVRRIIDLTEAEFDQKLEARFAVFWDAASTAEPPDPYEGMPRAKTGKLLNISLSQLDLLSRRDRPDPIPYYVVGESRRYVRAEVIAWLRRQRGIAA